MTQLLYEQKEDQTGRYLTITGCEGAVEKLYLPEQVDGLPVRSIGRFAFAGRSELREVHLPKSLYTLSLFAFQNCTSLQSIELWNTTEDYYDGVIRACTALKDVTVHCILPDNFIIVREMLRDTDAALRFHILMETGENARMDLTFPEYVSEAQEDTMARAIHFSIEGAGMAYRECVTKKGIDLTAYDRLLDRLTEYDFEAAADICLGRLMYPVSLRKEAKGKYEAYLRSHAARVLKKEIAERRTNAIRFLTKAELIPQEALSGALEAASKDKATEICSLLMEYQNTHFSVRKPEKLHLSW